MSPFIWQPSTYNIQDTSQQSGKRKYLFTMWEKCNFQSEPKLFDLLLLMKSWLVLPSSEYQINQSRNKIEHYLQNLPRWSLENKISTTISFLSLTFAYMVLVVINYYILTYYEWYYIFAKLEQLHLQISWGVEFH